MAGRGRPKGSKNKPKGNGTAPADQAPGPGHNGGALTDEQNLVLFGQHKRNYVEALDRKKKADANLKNVCKAAKSEGVKVEEIKLWLALHEPGGEAILKQRWEDEMRIARWAGSAIGTQFEMFPDRVDRTPDVDKAFEHGKRDGLQGEPHSSAWAPGTAQYERYREGYDAGQVTAREVFERNMKAPGDGASAEPDSDEEFDDSTSSKPSRPRSQADDGDAAGSYAEQ